eukprot:4167685-Amphidinium_carterae.1
MESEFQSPCPTTFQRSPNLYITQAMQHSDSVGSMASTVSVPMEEAFGDWTGEAVPPPEPSDHQMGGGTGGIDSWQNIAANSVMTLPTQDLGETPYPTQQFMDPPLHPSPFETVQSMEVDQSAVGTQHPSPPRLRCGPTSDQETHAVGANADDHPWGPPLTDDTLPIGDDAENMEDEAPLSALQEAPAPVTSNRDLTQIGYQRRSSNPAAYPQWTKGKNKIGSIPEDKPHPDWHHPANNVTPDRVAGAASGSGQNPRPTHPIYMAGQKSNLTVAKTPPARKSSAPPPTPEQSAKPGEICDEAILAIQKTFTLTSPPTALKHNFLMACYYLVDPKTMSDISPDVLPHPATLGNFVLASDASLTDRWGCRVCSTKDHPLRFGSAVDLIYHMNANHLTLRQTDELNDLMVFNVKVRHIVGALTCIDVSKVPLPLGSENLLPKQLPSHPSGSHNPKIGQHPWCYDRYGRRSEEARSMEATMGPSTYTYPYRLGIDDRADSSPPPAMRRSTMALKGKTITPPNKGAGKLVNQQHLKGKSSSKQSPHPSGKGSKTDERTAAASVPVTGGGGSTLGFPTPPTFTPMPLTYAASNPFTTPMLKLQLDMPLLCKSIPSMTLPPHPTLTSPFEFYTHNENVILGDFPRLSPYIGLLLLGYLRINHVIQESMCMSPHHYPVDDNTRLTIPEWRAVVLSPGKGKGLTTPCPTCGLWCHARTGHPTGRRNKSPSPASTTICMRRGT